MSLLCQTGPRALEARPRAARSSVCATALLLLGACGGQTDDTWEAVPTDQTVEDTSPKSEDSADEAEQAVAHALWGSSEARCEDCTAFTARGLRYASSVSSFQFDGESLVLLHSPSYGEQELDWISVRDEALAPTVFQAPDHASLHQDQGAPVLINLATDDAGQVVENTLEIRALARDFAPYPLTFAESVSTWSVSDGRLTVTLGAHEPERRLSGPLLGPLEPTEADPDPAPAASTLAAWLARLEEGRGEGQDQPGELCSGHLRVYSPDVCPSERLPGGIRKNVLLASSVAMGDDGISWVAYLLGHAHDNCEWATASGCFETLPCDCQKRTRTSFSNVRVFVERLSDGAGHHRLHVDGLDGAAGVALAVAEGRASVLVLDRGSSSATFHQMSFNVP